MNSRQPSVPKFLSAAACRAVVTQIRARGDTRVEVLTQWRGDARSARNRVYVARDWRNNAVGPSLKAAPDSSNTSIAGGNTINDPIVAWNPWKNEAVTNQVDPTSLHAIVAMAERDQRTFAGGVSVEPPPIVWTIPSQQYPATHIWSDQTYAQPPGERETIAVQLVAGAERAGMLAAGYLSVEALGHTLYTDEVGEILYAPQTVAQCSLTVRDPQGSGSGWAGASSYDWSRFDPAKLAEIALDKCLKSRNPVKIEPGRYTVILEPQATFDLIKVMMRLNGLQVGMLFQFMDRGAAERGLGPFAGRTASYQLRNGSTTQYHITRLGQRIMDERVNITFDPLDPDLGVVPFMDDGTSVQPVTWVERGVLKTLWYDRKYAVDELRQTAGQPNTGAFRMSGGTTTVEEMIATTTRGLLITRFWDVTPVDPVSMLSTGLTRDGVWLIEHGSVQHPVKNMRFLESPLFAFNQMEQLGVPVPVFTPRVPAIVPAVKVRDFNFNSLTDAI